MKSNFSLYGLPKDVKFCKKCVISNQRPNSVIEFKNKNNKKKGIIFNNDGLCQACEYSANKENINWKIREQNLEKLLSKYRKKLDMIVLFLEVVSDLLIQPIY